MIISHGDRTLLETTTFLTLGLGETKVMLSHNGETLTFLLNFVAEEPNKESMIRPEFVNDKTLRLTLINWNNPLGAGLENPVELGTFLKRRLTFAFFISKAGAKGEQRLVTLSFYLGAEVQNG